MNIAIISNGKCVDSALFDSLDTAREFLSCGVWPGADTVAELPGGFGIGDLYDGTDWSYTAAPSPAKYSEPAAEPARIEALEQQITALQQTIAEMREIEQ